MALLLFHRDCHLNICIYMCPIYIDINAWKTIIFLQYLVPHLCHSKDPGYSLCHTDILWLHHRTDCTEGYIFWYIIAGISVLVVIRVLSWGKYWGAGAGVQLAVIKGWVFTERWIRSTGSLSHTTEFVCWAIVSTGTLQQIIKTNMNMIWRLQLKVPLMYHSNDHEHSQNSPHIPLHHFHIICIKDGISLK